MRKQSRPALSLFFILIACSPSQILAEQIFSEREKMIILDFYNGGRAAGMIEAMCLLAEEKKIPLMYAQTMISVARKNKDAWDIAKWRLLDNSGLYAPCRLKIQSTN